MKIELIESLLNKGRTFEAYNELESALKDDPGNIRLQQLSGLTSARLGLLERAKKIMENLAGKENDSETTGILGRIYKDFWKTTGDLYYLDLSINTYMKAFLETKNGYNGINAASLTYLSGRREDAIKLAKETIIYVEQWVNDYWKEATLGEAFLLCGDTKAARKHYLNAVESGKSVPGSIHSTVEQLKLLSAVIPDAEEMRNLFDEINVVIFAGHMIDNPSGNTVRFPEYAAEKVKKQIGAFLDRIKANIGFSSLACGGDILFAESILERGLELNIIFPFKIDDFLKTSVDFASLQWKERFNAVLSKAHNIKFTTIEGYQGDDFLFDLCARQTMGLGILRAGLFSSRPWFLTVWNGETGNTGGTAQSVKWFPWPERHFNIHPGEFEQNHTPLNAAYIPLPYSADSQYRREMKYILFSDISGFSTLNEEKTPLFILHYLNAVSQKLLALKTAPVVLNTWGDAIFAVMDKPGLLAEYAFTLNEVVKNTDWHSVGLPQMDVRIALHAGPVYLANDPLLGNLNAFGTHINRAARMEPVTAPGSIYISEQFAAALLLEKKDEYIFDYAGIIELPKKFGRQEMFHLKRA